jgi:predicted transport protein
MDELTRGLVDEDEEIQEVTDPGYWEQRGNKTTLAMIDQLLVIVREFDPAVELKYNKFYVGLARDGQPHNFVVFRPRKNALMLTIRLKPAVEIQSKLEESALEVLEYDKREGGYRIRLGIDDLRSREAILRQLIGMAYQEHNA